MYRANYLSDRHVLVGVDFKASASGNNQTMLQELDSLRDLLAPTRYGTGLWAVGFSLLIAVWCLRSLHRLGYLVERICIQDSTLWQKLGTPQK